jgi:hypothetical protein
VTNDEALSRARRFIVGNVCLSGRVIASREAFDARKQATVRVEATNDSLRFFLAANVVGEGGANEAIEAAVGLLR